MIASLKQFLLTSAAGRYILIAPRAAMAIRSAGIVPTIAKIAGWSVQSREHVNFTYRTSRTSDLLLCSLIAEIAEYPASTIVGYLDELYADQELAAYVTAINRRSTTRWSTDPGFRPGRRLAYYLLVRALKPRFVVEAGVDRGLGAVLISRALQRNATTGDQGSYLGIESNSAKAIELFHEYPKRVGTIETGDSVEVLKAIDRQIDLFIHDTIPDDTHMASHLTLLGERLAKRGVIVSTWTTPLLVGRALSDGFRILAHQERPEAHWFAGDQLAFVFSKRHSGPPPANPP